MACRNNDGKLSKFVFLLLFAAQIFLLPEPPIQKELFTQLNAAESRNARFLPAIFADRKPEAVPLNVFRKIATFQDQIIKGIKTMDKNKEEKWYDNPTVLDTMLFLFPPAGMYGLYKTRSVRSNFTKVVYGILCFLSLLLAIMSITGK